MDRNRLLDLLLKRETGRITLPEIHELNNYLLQHEEDAELSELLSEVLKGNFNLPDIPTKRTDRFIQNIHAKTGLLPEGKAAPGKKFRPGRRMILLTAVAAALWGLIVLLFIQRNENTTGKKPNIYTTQKGSKSVLELPDGTKVWLNADTRLTCEKSYGLKTRTVILAGEAYFEVVHNEDVPFIVRTKTMDVKVLGTTFNVRAYDNDINTQATLIKGKVEVLLRSKNDEKIILKPSEKIIVKNIPLTGGADKHANPGKDQLPEMSVVTIGHNNTNDSTANEIQWTKNRLVFDQSDLRDILLELERWYGIKAHVKDSSLLTRKLSGNFENETLQEILESFKMAAGLKYHISNKDLTVYK